MWGFNEQNMIFLLETIFLLEMEIDQNQLKKDY